MPNPHSIAVIVPCYNEAATIASVVADFRRELPDATVFVIDNSSSDDTGEIARRAGARVLRALKRGKGHAVRASFQHIDAEYYVMVDGDGTYEPSRVHALLEPVQKGEADMAVGRRVSNDPTAAYRPMHVFGNRLVARLINGLFGAELTDIMSGYRAYHRDVVRATPLSARGFEIETELTVQALAQNFTIVERDTPYYARPTGSFSKLRTVRDGTRVLWTIFSLFMAFKPLTFFGSAGLVFLAAAGAVGAGPLYERFVSAAHRVESPMQAFLAALLTMTAFGCFFTGTILTSMNHRVMAILGLMARGRLAERAHAVDGNDSAGQTTARR